MSQNAGVRNAKPDPLSSSVVKQYSKKLKLRWMGMPAEFFATLVFGELKKGDLFIALPCPGDNDGHGGLRGRHNLFMKIGRHAAIKKSDNVRCKMTPSMDVVLIK